MTPTKASENKNRFHAEAQKAQGENQRIQDGVLCVHGASA